MQNEQDSIVTRDESNPKSSYRSEPLKLFPYDFSPSGILTLVHKNRSGGFYGPFNADSLANQAATFIGSNSDANEPALVQVIRNFLLLASQDCVAEVSRIGTCESRTAHSCWLCVRMTLPTEDWVVPRWHKDGRMFDCTCPEPRIPHSKYAVTILGPATRVMVQSPAVKEVMDMRSTTGRRWNHNEPDSELAERMSKLPEAKVQQGQVIRFSWGQQDSPVHSEPDSTGMHRVFVSILFGDEDELRHMCNMRNTKYDLWD